MAVADRIRAPEAGGAAQHRRKPRRRPTGLLAILLALALPFRPAAAAAVAANGGAPPRDDAIAMFGAPAEPPGFDHFPYADPAAPKRGRLIQTVTGTFDSLNPFAITGTPAAGLNGVYETLMARAWDEPFTLYGLLAGRVVVPTDRSAVTFTIRSGARFSDGTPVTADDVVFSWRILRDRGRPNVRTYYARVARAEILNPRTVRFTFRPPADRELPLIMGLMPVLPAHAWAGRDIARASLAIPVGSGPYAVAAVEPGRSITYRLRPDYWGRNLPVRRGMDNFLDLRFDYYRDDHAALAAFKAGLADLRREPDPVLWQTGYGGPALAAGRFRMEIFPNGRPAPFRGFVFNTRRPPFDDPRVRAALTDAFDFDWINRVYDRGTLVRSTSVFAESELAARGLPDAAETALLAPWRAILPAGLFREPFALPATGGGGLAALRPWLDRADRLLARAGWAVRDGRRVDAAGRPLAFTILLGDPADTRVALAYQANLDRLGIAVRVRTVDAAQYQERLTRFDYDMTVASWISTLSPGSEQAYYWGSRAARQPGSRNYAGVASPAVDGLVADLADAADRGALIAAARALDRVLMWGRYVIPFGTAPGDRVAYAARLAHPPMTPVYGPVIDAWWSIR